MTAAVDLDTYAIDGLVPQRVERPASTEELATVMREANREDRAVVLWAGGTRIGIGEPPARYEAAIDLRGLSGVIDHSPADLVCTVRAGTTLAQLADALAQARQRWPVDAADPEHATVGGTIASAAPSPSRLRFQHPRDWIIGCTAVLGDGTIARAGGRVVKNVTGYDLTRLYSGTFGTLAALAEVSLKLASVDERSRAFRVADLDAIGALSRMPVEGLVLATGDDAALYVRIAGLGAAVDRLARDVAKHGASEVDDVTWRTAAYAPAGKAFVARAAVPPWRERELASGDAVAYLGTGTVLLTGDRTDEELRDIRARCERMGGALVLERADAHRKRALGVWGTPRGAPQIARALKQRFDPRGVLAPGRLPV